MNFDRVLGSPAFGQLISLTALFVGTWIAHRFTKPKDHERAALLATIANGCAALVLTVFPNQPWPVLLGETIARIEEAAGLPTNNEGAIRRAAIEALMDRGVKPE